MATDTSTRRYQITSGPSREELFDSLRLGSETVFEAEIPGEKCGSYDVVHSIGPHVTQIKVTENPLERGDAWQIRIAGPYDLWFGYYNTKTRKGAIREFPKTKK